MALTHRFLRFGILLVIVLSGAVSEGDELKVAGDWPWWRGPNADGVSRDRNLLKAWPAGGPHVARRVDSVGMGFSSVVIAGGRVFTQGDLNGVEHIIAVDESTGRTLWAVCPPPIEAIIDSRVDTEMSLLDGDGDGKLSAAEALPRFGLRMYLYDMPTADANTRITEADIRKALATPGAQRDGTITADELKKFFEEEKLAGDGILTRQELRSLVGGFRHPFGDGPRGTPTVDGGRLYALGGTGDLSCLDVSTGQTIWHRNLVRDEKFVHDHAAILPTWGYFESPLVVESVVMVTLIEKPLTLIALNKSTGETVTLTADLQRLYAQKHFARRRGATVELGEYVYTVDDSGLACMTATTGEMMWRVQGVGKGSICAADGMLYVLGENREVLLAEANSAGYRERGRFRIPTPGKKPIWSYPVVTGGKMYLRDQQSLTAYDVRTSASPAPVGTPAPIPAALPSTASSVPTR